MRWRDPPVPHPPRGRMAGSVSASSGRSFLQPTGNLARYRRASQGSGLSDRHDGETVARFLACTGRRLVRYRTGPRMALAGTVNSEDCRVLLQQREYDEVNRLMGTW
jgi:hypothetical protein